jgi:MICOS complex subunit MIC19
MGAGQSTANGPDDEKVFYSQTPVQFSQDVVNHLSDNAASTETTPERQTTLDAHIRARIQAELAHLRQEEENVRQEITKALEKENLDREREMAGGEAGAADATESEGGVGSVKSSAALQGDLEEVRQKLDKYKAKQELTEALEIKAHGEAVVNCYKYAHLRRFNACILSMFSLSFPAMSLETTLRRSWIAGGRCKHSKHQ